MWKLRVQEVKSQQWVQPGFKPGGKSPLIFANYLRILVLEGPHNLRGSKGLDTEIFVQLTYIFV